MELIHPTTMLTLFYVPTTIVSGCIPKELGNLPALKQVHLDSNQLNGKCNRMFPIRQ